LGAGLVGAFEHDRLLGGGAFGRRVRHLGEPTGPPPPAPARAPPYYKVYRRRRDGQPGAASDHDSVAWAACRSALPECQAHARCDRIVDSAVDSTADMMVDATEDALLDSAR